MPPSPPRKQRLPPAIFDLPVEEVEAKGVPVDSYGVGSTLIRGENEFTADVVVG